MADQSIVCAQRGRQVLLGLMLFLAGLLFIGSCPSWASPFTKSPWRPPGAHPGGGRAALPPHQALDVPLARGRFLVAAEKMGDPRFAEAVILLVEYGQSGALGLIINRPTEMTLSGVLPDLGAPEDHDRTVYLGGPVDVTRLTILVQSDDGLIESAHVFRDVYVTGSRKALEQLLRGEPGSGTFRIYAGYAGWAPQQLEREIAAGGWHVVEADTASVFRKEPSRVWPDLMRQLSVLWVLRSDGGAEIAAAGSLFP